MILTEKLQKYEHYHLVKLIKNELLTCKEVPPPVKVEQQNKLSLLSFRKNFRKGTKAIEDQGEKQVKAI